MRIIALTNPFAGDRYKIQIQQMIDSGADVTIVNIAGVRLTLFRIFRTIKLIEKNGIKWFLNRRKNFKEIRLYSNYSLKIEVEVLKQLNISPNYEIHHNVDGFGKKLNQLLKSEMPDFIFQSGIGIVPSSVVNLGIPILNFHPGILPGIRGVSPLFWADFYKKMEWRGTTLHYIDNGIDTGEPIIRRKVPSNIVKSHYAEYFYDVVKAECFIIDKLIREGIDGLKKYDEGGDKKSIYKSYYTKSDYESLYGPSI